MTLITSTNGIFRKFREELAIAEGTTSGHDLDADTIRAVGADIGSAAFGSQLFCGQMASTTATTVTTTGNHGLAVGDMIIICNPSVDSGISGTWRVLTAPSTTEFTFGQWDTGTAYTTMTAGAQTGQVINLSYSAPTYALLQAGTDITMSDASAAISSPTATLGIFDDDGSNTTLLNVKTSPSTNLDSIFIFNDDHTSDRLLAVIESFTALVTNGNNVTVTWGSDGIFRL